MRKLLPFLGLLLCGAAFGQTFVTSGNCTTGGTTCTITVSVTSGNTIFCGVGSQGPVSTTGSCTAPDVTTWTAPSGSPFTGTSAKAFMFQGTVNATTSEVVTCNYDGNEGVGGCSVLVFSGASGGWDVALAGANNSATTSFTSGTSATTAQATEVAIGFFTTTSGAGAAWTGTNGYTCPTGAQTVSNPDSAACYLLLSSTGVQTATATTVSSTGVGVVSTLKTPGGGGGSSCTSKVTLKGVGCI